MSAQRAAIRASSKTKRTAKADLPSKICAACKRPFAWRKKWRKDWEQVKFCSDACRGKR